MEVQLRDPADRAALERGAVTRNDPTRRDRFRAVLHAVDGMEAVPIASKIHRSRRFVQNWVYRYRDGGVAAMEDKPRPGKACKLTAEERERFRRRILDGPTEAGGRRRRLAPEQDAAGAGEHHAAAAAAVQPATQRHRETVGLYPLPLPEQPPVPRLRPPVHHGVRRLPRGPRAQDQVDMSDYVDRARASMRKRIIFAVDGSSNLPLSV